MLHLKQDKRVIGQPADEENNNKRSHYFEGFGRFGHSVGLEFYTNNGVADDDDDKRDNKPHKEAAKCNHSVNVSIWCVVVEAFSLAQMTVNIPKDQWRNTQRNGEKPRQDNNNGCRFNSAMVLGPNWEHDWHKAIDTDDDQDEDATEHIEEHNAGGKLAHEAAEDPVLHRRVGDAER